MDNEIEINGVKYVKKEEHIEKLWPQDGDRFWFVGGTGGTREGIFTNSFGSKMLLDRGNFFQTKEQAEMYSLRIESLGKGFIPKNWEDFWKWSFNKKMPELLIAFNEFTYLVWLPFPKFRTEQECQEWGDKYAKAWTYLHNQ